MSDPTGIAFVRDHRREPLGKAKPPLRLRQQLRRPPSKAAVIFLRSTAGKREWQQIIVGGGGRGTLQSVVRIGFTNQILRQLKSLRYIRQPKSAAIMNNAG